MGRETRCQCRWGAEKGQVVAKLESAELLLRGDIRRQVPLTAMQNVLADVRGLSFAVGEEMVLIELPAAEAASWARKIAAPPPSLRQKLGLHEEGGAFVVGPVDTPELADALCGAVVSQPAQARMMIASASNDDALQAALRVHASLPPGAPIWVIHGKGRDARFGESAVRSIMRAAGFIDTKVASVSSSLTATRYGKASDRKAVSF
jgi:hypothetical protein